MHTIVSRELSAWRFKIARAPLILMLAFFSFTSLVSAQNFRAVQTYGTDLHPSAVALGDFNKDGNLDLVVANQGANDVSVLLGNGDGTFHLAVQYASGGTGPVSIVVADFDGDGNPDIAIANAMSANVGILFGNGDGTFQPAVSFPVGNGPSAIAAGDLNGDGSPDLVAANSQDNTVSILFNVGNRGFVAGATYNVDGNPVSLALGDLNGDGLLDIAVANQGTNDVSVLLSQGNGAFAAATNYCVASIPAGQTCAASAPIQPASVAIGDVNNDMQPDLVVASLSGSVTVLLNGGGGSFSEQTPLSIGVNPRSIAVADFNGDGNKDVAIADSGTNSFRVLPGNGDGTFGPPLEFVSGTQPVFLATSDFNADKKIDLVIANYGDGDVAIALGNGDGTFQAAPEYPVGVQPNSIVSGDFNSDGILDLLVENEGNVSGAFTASLLLSNGNGTFQPAVAVPINSEGPVFMSVGDFNKDQNLDLVTANAAANTVTVLFGNGLGGFGSGSDYATDSGPVSVAVADFNGDGFPDIATANQIGNDVSVLINNAAGSFASHVDYPAGASPVSIAAADLNGDGFPDIVVSNSGNQTLSVLLNNRDGTFATAVPYSVGNVPQSVAIADLNGDGALDLVAVNSADDTVSVLLGNGTGTFAPAVNYPIPTGSGAQFVKVADVTSDGIPDIIVADTKKNLVSVLPGHGDGTFGSAINYSTGLNPVSIAIGDFNGDQKFDLATANSGSNDVTLLLSKGAPAKAATSTALNSSMNPSAFGQSITLTATVSSITGTPTGTVNFMDGASLIGTGTLSAGITTLVTSSLALGSRSITANYGGDASFTASASTSLTQTVDQATSSVTLVAGPNPSAFAQAVTFTGTISPQFGGAATGSATFNDGAISLGTATISNNVAIFTTSTLPAGAHSITAVYGGDTNFMTSTSSAVIETVNSGGTAVTMTASPNPAALGATVTLTGTVTTSASGTPTGTLTFMDGTNPLATVTLSAGLATLATPSLSPGAHSIAANYSGDSNFSASSSAPLVLTVNRTTSSVAIGSSVNASFYFQPVTFTATIVPQYGIQATGTVTFQDGATPLGTASVAGNLAAITLNMLSVGAHSITAAYSGDGNVTASVSSPIAQMVNKASTSSTVVSSVNPSNPGQAVTLTVMVSPQFPGNTPTGTVTLKKNGVALGTFPLNSGQASYTISSLNLGSYSITAVYNGDSNFTSDTSPALVQAVDKIATTTTLTSSANPSNLGQAVTFTAAVAASSGAVPDGELITFTSSGATLGTVPLSGGTATLTTSSLARGLYYIKATYPGDGAFSNSNSPVINEAISAYNTTTTLASSGNPVSYGQTVTFSVTVTSTSGIPPTGTVTFKNAGATLGTQTLSNGAATLSNSTLSAGTHTITALYGGDTNNAASVSAAISQVVTKAQYPQVTPSTTQITFTNGTPLFPGQSRTVPVTFTVASGKITSVQKAPSAKPLSGGDEYTSEADDITQDAGCVGTWQTGDSCTINYTFSADNDDQGCNPGNTITVAGNKVQVPPYGCIGTVQFNVPNNPNPIVITYTVMVMNPNPQIAISPLTLNFPNTTVGGSSQLGATISNSGSVPLNITNIAVTLNPSQFSQTNNCPASLAPQQSCYLNVTFAPAKVGSLTGTITVSDNDTNVSAPKTIHLRGTGTS